MVDTTIDSLPADASPTSDDVMHTVNDPAGTPTDKKVTIANLSTAIFGLKDTDDLTEGTTNKYLTAAEETKLSYISVTQAVDLDTMESDIASNIANVVEDTTPQLGGDVDYNSNGIKVVGQTVGGSNGDSVYLSGSNTWSQADASAESTCKTALGIRISATEVLVQGVYTTTGLTAGSLYYVSETAGSITATAPTTSLSIVRPIGYALTTTELYVFPDSTFVENA